VTAAIGRPRRCQRSTRVAQCVLHVAPGVRQGCTVGVPGPRLAGFTRRRCCLTARCSWQPVSTAVLSRARKLYEQPEIAAGTRYLQIRATPSGYGSLFQGISQASGGKLPRVIEQLADRAFSITTRLLSPGRFPDGAFFLPDGQTVMHRVSGSNLSCA